MKLIHTVTQKKSKKIQMKAIMLGKRLSEILSVFTPDMG